MHCAAKTDDQYSDGLQSCLMSCGNLAGRIKSYRPDATGMCRGQLPRSNRELCRGGDTETGLTQNMMGPRLRTTLRSSLRPSYSIIQSPARPACKQPRP